MTTPMWLPDAAIARAHDGADPDPEDECDVDDADPPRVRTAGAFQIQHLLDGITPNWGAPQDP